MKMLHAARSTAFVILSAAAGVCLAGGVPSISSEAAVASRVVVVDQAHLDAALSKLRDRIALRLSNPAATQPIVKPPTAPDDPIAAAKMAMMHEYDARIANARAALRHGDVKPGEVRQLLNEQAVLQHFPLERFGQMLNEASTLNEQRLTRYRSAFGELADASRTVITILMKAGLVDTATVMADDPLSEEIELGRGVRRVYYQFTMPPRDALSASRHHNGYIEFQLAAKQALWLPTWADLEGSPIALFEAEAFLPLQKYSIRFDGRDFSVMQEQPTEPPSMLFSLLAPRMAFPTVVKNISAYR